MTSPQSKIDDLLIQGTCAVRLGGQLKGSAWLLDNEGHLLTAGHILGQTDPVDEVEVLFPDDDLPRRARKIRWYCDHDRGIDCAVLEIMPPLPDRTPLPICLPRNIHGSFKLYGFGKTLRDISPGGGTFIGPYHPQNKFANRLFSLETLQTREGGYSGAAIFSHDLKAVVAIQIEGTTVPANAAQGTTILAMPLYRIAEVCRDIRIFSEALTTFPNEPYYYHVYLSYARGGLLEKWLEKYFLDELQEWLSLELGVEKKELVVFSNHDARRAVWDAVLIEAIQRSVCLVPILTSTYWGSPECLAELESFKARQDEENIALTLGVLFHEKGTDPGGATTLQYEDFHDHAKVFDGFRTSANYEKFQDAVKVFAKQLAGLIQNAPQYEKSWPVVSPSKTRPWKPTTVPRISRPSL
jgi:hypothetical protein